MAELEAATRRNDRVRILPLDLEQTREVALLGALADPFDRMIVAAARATRRALVTADATIADSAWRRSARGSLPSRRENVAA